jgi:flavin-dependent dehydrogenase
MEWIWEIPIHSNVIGVGYVAAGDAIKDKRKQGFSVEEIFRERLARIPRFSELQQVCGSTPPHVTSFQCRVHSGLAGPNWVVVGEAASMADPLTANGVTAALRHAADASALIVPSGRRRRLPYVAGSMYTKRVVALNRFFNCDIEKTIYDRAIRSRIGVLTAGHVYTIPAWVLNSVYSRINPTGVVSTMLFGFVLNLFRWASIVFSALCIKFPGKRQVAA